MHDGNDASEVPSPLPYGKRTPGGLPAGLPAAVFVVLHIPATGGGALPRILDRSGPLPAAAAVDGERIALGRVYVAPPDEHLLVIADYVRRAARSPLPPGRSSFPPRSWPLR